MTRDPNRFWNPYLAGLALGGVLLAVLVLTGKGLGASGATFRAGVTALHALVPSHVESVPLMADKLEGGPLRDWLVFEVAGALLGAFLAAWTSGRLRREVLRGPTFAAAPRLGLALLGGSIMGAAAQMARGCTSGQALSGGALLSAGSWGFMMSVFAGGYAFAWLVRRQWR
jgi:hypothetical protein